MSNESVPGSELARRLEAYRSAYEARDVDGMLALFADDAEVVAAPGTFRGKAALRKLFEWDVRMSPTATVRDAGLGVLVSGRTVVWERELDLTAEGVGYVEKAATMLIFDDAGLIRQVRSYYDKLAILDQIASGTGGISGWFFSKLTGYLVAQGSKGLDAPRPDG